MSDLAAFLARHAPLCTDNVVWGWNGVPTPLRQTTYLSDDEPPLDLVTSVRAVVRRGGEVLVVREPNGDHHIVPGGRCEAGETIEATLRRELLEETGWALSALSPLAVVHYRHLGPRPTGYAFPYPDFAQLVFLAEAGAFDPAARIPDEWVAEAAFVAWDEARQLIAARASDRMLLDAALGRWGVR